MRPPLTCAPRSNATLSASRKRRAIFPDAAKARHPDVDWRGVADVGNVLRHAYEQVVDRGIWEIVTADLAPLKLAIEKMTASAGSS